MPEVGSSERKPSFSEVLARARGAAKAGLFVMLPGAVTKVDPNTRKVDVQLLIKDAYLDESDDRQVQTLGVVPSCPVVYPPWYCGPVSDGTLTVFNKTWPATMGAVVFCDRSMDKWMSGGGQEVDPEIDHEHDPTDGVFFPGLWPFSKAPPFFQDAIYIGDTSGGSAAFDFVALAKKVDKAISTIFHLLDGVFGNSSTVIPAGAPPASDPVYLAVKAAIAALVLADPTQWPPASTAASQLKTQ